MKDKILHSQAKVRFQDCDPYNHLNNSKYIDYFVNAREDQLINEYNIDVFKVANERKKAWVIGNHKIAFLAPATLHEVLHIESQLVSFNTKSLKVEMKMYNEDRSRLKAVLWSTYVHIDLRTQKPCNHDPDFMKLFNEVCLPLNEQLFDQRVLQIKSAA